MPIMPAVTFPPGLTRALPKFRKETMEDVISRGGAKMHMRILLAVTCIAVSALTCRAPDPMTPKPPSTLTIQSWDIQMLAADAIQHAGCRGPGCRAPTTACTAPQCQERCRNHVCLLRWLTYRALPVPCECRGLRTCAPVCTPPLYAY